MGFKYVLVPASSDDMQELTFDGKAELEDDHFVKHLKQYFGSLGAGVDREVLLNNMAEHAKKDVKELKEQISSEVLEGICATQALDIFPVMVPQKDTGYLAVSLYCDDKGIAKDLPLNPRAMSFVRACGYEGQQYRGDIFFGRVYDNEDEAWKRIDFTMKDFSSDAEWVQQTRKVRQATNSSQSLKDLQQTLQLDTNNTKTISNSNAAASGETDIYSWNDKGEEVEVTFKKPGVKKGDVKVTFKPKHLIVQIASDVVLDVELFQKVSREDCTWTIMDGGMQLTLSKQHETAWSSLVAC